MPAKKNGRTRKKCRHCNNSAASREVCAKHNRKGNILVEAGKYTDAQLVKIGYWAESKPSGRPAEDDDVVTRLEKAARRK